MEPINVGTTEVIIIKASETLALGIVTSETLDLLEKRGFIIDLWRIELVHYSQNLRSLFTRLVTLKG